MTEGIKPYSAVVTNKSNVPIVSSESLKQAVKNAIVKEDRGRNVMFFGLAEEEGEQLENKVSELLQELDLSALDERAVRKQLVLKKAINEQPGRHHYIRGGSVHSEDKARTWCSLDSNC